MDNIAIKAENLSKQYNIGSAGFGYTNVRDWLAETIKKPIRFPRPRLKKYKGTIWALKDVSFEIKRGEVIGVIGRNGAGKSTLLKILSRITRPTKGLASVNGRVGSLLEVGTGFHEELTGRENIYLNGAILGMKNEEITRKFDEIVMFACLGKFLDTAIKYYSSGMYLRLAFSVAAHLESEILLLDEVLAVGDAEFQKKCLAKVGNMAERGRTIMFVSHNLAAVQNFCNRSILLEKGSITGMGQTDIIINKYLKNIAALSEMPLKNRLDRQGNMKLKITEVKFIYNKRETKRFCSGDDISIDVAYEAKEEFRPTCMVFYLSIKTQQGFSLSLCQSDLSGISIDKIKKTGRLRCVLFSVPLAPGAYSGNVACEEKGDMVDWVADAFSFEVMPGNYFENGKIPAHSPVLLRQKWSVIS